MGQSPALSPDARHRAATLLAEHRRRRATLAELPADIRPATFADAYAIQDDLVDQLCAAQHGHRIGYKVACTNPVAQQALRVDSPLFGQLLSHSTSVTPAGLDAAAFTTRVIECEFGLRIGTTVPNSTVAYDAAGIGEFVDAVLPAIEIVDHRFVDWSLGATSIAADNAIHGYWIHGEPYTDWRSLDLAAHELEARIDGSLVGRGTGAAVLGHPLNVLAWLANELPRYGHQLQAGDLITTGVCTDVFSAEAGQTVVADFGSLGTVTVHWDGAESDHPDHATAGGSR